MTTKNSGVARVMGGAVPGTTGVGGVCRVRECFDWPRLLAIEPGLRPLQIQHGREIGDEINAALQRDAAVRWLLKEAQQEPYLECNPAGDQWVIVVHVPERKWFCLPTLDDALFAACEAILNARGRVRVVAGHGWTDENTTNLNAALDQKRVPPA